MSVALGHWRKLTSRNTLIISDKYIIVLLFTLFSTISGAGIKQKCFFSINCQLSYKETDHQIIFIHHQILRTNIIRNVRNISNLGRKGIKSIEVRYFGRLKC